MATDIGKAYVQIVPSAKGLSGSITNELKNESNDAGKKSGLNIVGAIKKVIATAAIGQTLKMAVSEGAKLEQSYIGGLDTLYGSAADQMRSLAMEAASAGISANDYAEQAVSFGAALKQSFDGAADAEKLAGEAANLAILDMADNAAKMGTDLSSIQNAYQGFAKQNYTMLDNLKLGYGGTKSEMERLLKDAQKLSGVKYDINNLADVYSAIHVIQEDLGIAGVAAEEAGSTISGSFGAMQAAAKNLLGNLTLGNDIGPYLNTLVDSVIKFGSNLLPAIRNVLSGVVEAIPLMFSKIGDLISSNMPQILAAGWDIIVTLGKGLMNAVPVILKSMGDILKSVWDVVKTINWKELGGNVIRGIAYGIAGLVSVAVLAIGKVGTEIWNKIRSINWLELGSNIIQGLINGLTNGISAVASAAREVAQSAWNAAKNFLGIGSPSKLFRYLGEMTDEGLAGGISSNVRYVQDAMNDVTDAMMEPMVPLTTDFGVGNTPYSGTGSSINYGGININFNVPEGMNGRQLFAEFENMLANSVTRRRAVFE